MAAGQPSTATAQPGAVSAYKAPGLRSYARRTADRLSFKVNLIVGISALVLLTGVALIMIADRSSRATASDFAGGLFRGASEHVVTHARSFVNRAVPLVDSMARLGDNGLALDDSDRLARQLVSILPANPGVTWLSFSDEAGTFTGAYRTAAGTYRVNQSRIVDGRTRLAEHNVLPGGQWAIHRRLEDTGYDPRVRPFYVEARRAGAMVWLPPYVFYDEAVPGVSCAKPLYGGHKQLLGVVSADFDLNTLSSFVSDLSVSKNSKFFLFTQDGTLLAYPRTQVVRSQGKGASGTLLTLKDINDPMVQEYRRSLPAGIAGPGEGMGTGTDAEAHFYPFKLRYDGKPYFASATAFHVGGDSERSQVWVVGGLAPEEDFVGGARRARYVSLAVAAGAVLIAVLLATLLAARVSGPVGSLVAFMRRVGEGELDTRIDVGGSREFRQASAALNRMIGELRDGLRLRHSLNVAMEVQQRLLPSKPPVVAGLDLAGHSTYCDETGGDYYDYLVLDQPSPRGALLALGDVMGHGVSAALVMAGARAVLRTRAAVDGNLAKMTATLNRLLCADLGGERFMTMHLSYIDLDTRAYRWCSAGHDPALIWDPRRRVFDQIDAGDLPLGVMESTSYNEASYPLGGGEVIVVGTDGIWQTCNAAGEQFGKLRLKDAVHEVIDRPASEIVDEIVRRLNEFRGGGRREDDVTLIVARILPFERADGEDSPRRVEVRD